MGGARIGTLRAMPPPRAPSSPLRRREFRLYFAGNLISNVGSWLNNVALGVYMLDLTGSSLWVGVVGAGLSLPVLLFALPAGVLADRSDRLSLLRRAQVLMGALAALLTVLVALDAANRYAVVAISLGLGAGIAIAIPTMQALVPNMVPPRELPDAISLNALTFNVARVAGPLIAAGALTVGAVWAFGINAASFFVLVVALTLVGRPPFPRPPDGGPGPIREGVAYAWRHLRTRWMLLAIVAIGLSLDPIMTLSPALAQRYGLREGGAGLIVAAWGGGAVGMLALGRGVIRRATERGLGWLGLLGLAAGIGGYGAATTTVPALVALLVSGVGYITATMAFTTSIQRDVPDSLRGRVSALWTLAFLGPRAFASVLDGALADAIGPRPAAALFAIPALVAAVALRRVETAEGEPVAPPA